MTDPQYRVLIVEDETDINNLLAEILSVYGLEPIQAFTGEDGLRLVEKHRPDAILLDLMLPGQSGYGVCRHLKSARETRGIPVLILTALDRAADRSQAFETGADEFLTKPFSPEGLVGRVREAIQRSREATRREGHVTMAFELGTSEESLKAVNALVTTLYCRTALSKAEIEEIRSGVVRLAAAAGAWKADRGAVPPVHVTFDLDGERLVLRFEPTGPEGEAFAGEHLDPNAVVPAEFTDAGVVDRQRREDRAVVMEKRLPPAETAEPVAPREESPGDRSD